jgi:hypothetical protein
MMRKQASLINVIVTLILLSVLLPAPVQAHSITVDGDPSDWDPSGYAMDPPTTDDTGHIGRDSSSQGQYIWKDKANDELTNGMDPDTNYDLTEFRVTANSTNLYFLAVFSDTTSTTLPYLTIAVDLDQDGTGNTAFQDDADTSVSADARWERQIVVNSDKTGYFDESPTWNDVGSHSISTANDVIEVSMPLSDLGISLPAMVRFTVLVGEHDGSGGIEDIASSSDALDCVTNAANTATEVGDGEVDYYFDVRFNSDGEAYSPLLITGFMYDPAKETTEWVRITNVSGQSIDISDFKLGDEETKGENEGMKQFDSGTFNSGSIVATRNATDFYALAGYDADYEWTSSGSSVPDMSIYGAWNNGSFNFNNDEDEILLLDDRDTVIDAISYESGSYSGVNPHGGVPGCTTAPCDWLERSPLTADTNDASNDFTVQENQDYPPQPTLIELASFTATPHDGYVLVEWETASEIDNDGFNLWRSEAAGGEYAKLNADLIPAQGGPTTGASYSYNDEAVINGITYWYKLEDVDLYSASTFHGPVSATPRQLHRLYLPLLLKGGHP